jgi:hypothetical protein
LKLTLKILFIFVLIPALLIAGLATYYWITYIDEEISSGSAYGFTIGSTKAEAVRDFGKIRSSHPEIHVYVTYGERAGDNFSTPAIPESLHKLEPHDRWFVLLDGKTEFFNSTNLLFEDDKLVIIHRHRQYFELP